MPDASHGSCDFFISYNKADLAWAEWVGSVLEQAGYTYADVRRFGVPAKSLDQAHRDANGRSCRLCVG